MRTVLVAILTMELPVLIQQCSRIIVEVSTIECDYAVIADFVADAKFLGKILSRFDDAGVYTSATKALH
jgi:hypothetical protein